MNPALDCATRIVAELLAAGVREAVLSPGSRSAPLAYALHAAAQADRLRLHVRIDERTAGFLALGLAKVSGSVVAVITTSGTAAANLHPAVLEASHSGVPIMIITADRPSTMIDTGANQTTRQRGLFSEHVVADAALEADLLAGDRGARVIAHQLHRLLAAAGGGRSRRPGPVHLNVGFGDPLVPDEAVDLPEVAPFEVTSSSAAVAPLRLDAGPRTVVLVGDARPETGARAVALAHDAKLPLLAEPSGNARGAHEAICAYRVLLGGPLARQIERVIMVGRPTLSRPVQRLLARSDVELIILADTADWIDPGVNAAQVVDELDCDPDDGRWLGLWRQADDRLRPMITQMVEGEVITGPWLAEQLWQRLGSDDVLVVGSSNPIRDVDLAGANPTPPTVYANRGLAGIDGTVSTAVGVALAGGTPTHALVGDLTLLHDVTGLLIGPQEPRPDLRIVVASDGGGSIFSTLEQGTDELSDAFERIFATPHTTDLSALAAAFGVGYRRVETPDQLPSALDGDPHGIELVEVLVDRSGRRALDLALRNLAAPTP